MIVLLGDSITQLAWSPYGFGAHLQDVYQRRCDVLNRGYSGYNTRWILKLLQAGESVFGRGGAHDEEGCQTTELVVVFFGANDSALLEQTEIALKRP